MKYEPITITVKKTTTFTASDGKEYSSEFDCRKAVFLKQAVKSIIDQSYVSLNEMIVHPHLLWKFVKHMKHLQKQYNEEVRPYLERELPF